MPNDTVIAEIGDGLGTVLKEGTNFAVKIEQEDGDMIALNEDAAVAVADAIYAYLGVSKPGAHIKLATVVDGVCLPEVEQLCVGDGDLITIPIDLT